jgi:hypothetical protein
LNPGHRPAIIPVRGKITPLVVHDVFWQNAKRIEARAFNAKDMKGIKDDDVLPLGLTVSSCDRRQLSLNICDKHAP